MGIWICRWENGDCSIVGARNKDDAYELLDEVGDPEGCQMFSLKEFAVHFHLTDDGSLDFEAFSESLLAAVEEKLYPIVSGVRAELTEADLPPEKQATVLRKAADEERRRLWGELTRKKKFDSEYEKQVDAQMGGLPPKVRKGIAQKVANAVLAEAPDDGIVN